MNLEEAEKRWEMAERKLRGCEAHLDRANKEWRFAEAARGNNKIHSRLKGTYGSDYMKKIKETREGALREFDRAREEEEKARADYKAMGGDL
ncbi:MAG: hypothetical protein OXH81_27380 [Gemmatimonadetes bacterium]|nr:hypothetical protein [Gemmatimonadota bacterium]